MRIQKIYERDTIAPNCFHITKKTLAVFSAFVRPRSLDREMGDAQVQEIFARTRVRMDHRLQWINKIIGDRQRSNSHCAEMEARNVTIRLHHRTSTDMLS
jgi:hypothetical protein